MYNWNIQRHKVGNGQQEIKVSILIKELAHTYAYNSESWCERFKDELKKIPRTNSFSAEYGFKATPRNEKSLEVWKMKANGEFNYKMYTVTLIGKDESDQPNIFKL